MILTLDWNSRSPKEEIFAGFRTLRLRLRQPGGDTVTIRELLSYVLTLPRTVYSLAEDIPDIPEVINSEDVGILVRSEDVDGLESALRKLLTSDELRVALGSQLQKRVSAHFT
jgi:glycosyltransferase involved in cell wall biosynthesis